MGNISAAARIAGVSKGMVFRARGEDERFAEAWEEALSVAHDLLVQIAIRRATSGEPKVITRRRVKRDAEGAILEEETTTEEQLVVSNQLLWRLVQVHGPGYSDRIHYHSAPDGGPIQQGCSGSRLGSGCSSWPSSPASLSCPT